MNKHGVCNIMIQKKRKEICTLVNMAALLKISSKNMFYLWSNFPKSALEYYIPPMEYLKENYMQATFF